MRCQLYICVILVSAAAKKVVASAANLNDISGSIECGDLFVASEDTGKSKRTCLPKVNLGEGCLESIQCPGIPGTSSVCDTVCGCMKSYIHIGVENCLEIIDEIVKTCEASEQCQTGKPGYRSECIQLPGADVKTCQCTPGSVHPMFETNYVVNRDACFPVANKVGDECVVHDQCIPNLINGICSSGTCQCARNTTSYPGSPCLPDVDLFERCEHSGQCLHNPHSACINKTCLCDAGYMEFNMSCIPLATHAQDSSDLHEDQCETEGRSWAITIVNFGDVFTPTKEL